MTSKKEKIKVGISSCLIGEKVRYDGGHKLDRFITNTLGCYFEWIPVCPEVECGLPVPREAMHLVGTPEVQRLITIKSNIDHTEKMRQWIKKKLQELEREELCGFVFKSKSPSSGISGVKIHHPAENRIRTGSGLFGGAFMKHFPLLPVVDDGRLHNDRFRVNFVEGVFVYKRWREFLKQGASIRNLVDFHTDHKLLLMAHSPKHYIHLGRLVARAKEIKRAELFAEYIRNLMDGVRLMATARKNTNVLHHILGYFKKRLSSDEKQELQEVIDNYQQKLTPLIVPVTLIKHYVRKFDITYLRRQYYLNLHPIKLILSS